MFSLFFQMAFRCPFPEGSHNPPGPWFANTRRSLRRHVNLRHDCDLRAEVDTSGHLRDVVRPCSPADLAARRDNIRRRQGRTAGRSGPQPGVVAAFPSVVTPPPTLCSVVEAAVSGSGPAFPSVVTPPPALLSLYEGLGADLSAGVDFEVDWDGQALSDSLLDLACPVARSYVGVVNLQECPASSATLAAASGPDSGLRGVSLRGDGGQGMEGGRPAAAASEGDQPPVMVAEAGCQTDAPRLVGVTRIADVITQAAVAMPLRGPFRLAHNAVRLLGLETPEELYAVDAAAFTAVTFERVLVERLGLSAANGLLLDPSAASSLASVIIELHNLQSRRSTFPDPAPEPEEPRPVLAIEEPPIVIDDLEDLLL